MKKFPMLLGIPAILLSGFVVLAQETQTPTTSNLTGQPRQRDRAGRRIMRGRARMRARAIRELNLTDTQKQQAQALRRENLERNRAVREELKQLLQKRQQGALTEADQLRARQLRQQLRESRLNTRTQIARLLTEEQRTRLQEVRKIRREDRERFGRRRPNRPI